MLDPLHAALNDLQRVAQEGGDITAASDRLFLLQLAQRQITCLSTGAPLDARHTAAVIVATESGTSGWKAIDASCWDSIKSAVEKMTAALGGRLTVLDGRDLFTD